MTSREDQSEVFLSSDAMNEEFFIDIVERKLNMTRDKFKIRLVLLTPAAGKNENYLSVLYRAKIKVEILETKVMQLVEVIIKALVALMKALEGFSVFPRERFMYENVLSSFEKIWLDRAGEKILFGPKSIKFETEPYEIIVLDDLKAAKYEMLNRKVGANLDQTKVLLAKIAKFHAAGAIRYQQDGTIKDFLDRKAVVLDLSDDSPFVAGFRSMFNSFVTVIENFGCYNEIVEKMRKWNSSDLMNQFNTVAEPMRCGFRVLNHGDLWLNNMMFKSDEENNVLDVSLIDYQVNFWASPTPDLLYFLISSVTDDIKVDNFDEFVKFYHEHLTNALTKLNYDQHIPTLEELYEDMHEKSGFAASCLTGIMFVVKYDSSEEIEMEELFAGNRPDMVDKVYNNENFKKALNLWLPFLNSRGYFDGLASSA